MNFINQSIDFLKDVQSKRGHFPNKVLNWQIIGKYVGAMNKIVGNGIAQNISNKRHAVTIEFLKNEFSEYLNSYTPVKTQVDCKENSPIIWTLWLQGFDCAPDLVKVALKNTEQFALNNGFQFRFLDEETLYDYVDFPEWIIEKRKSGILTNTGLADLLRVTLLAEYGGVWVDSTVFIHKEFPISYLKKNYFTIKTGEMEDYSPNISKNRWKTFFLSGNSELFSFTRDFFFEYYKKYDLQVDYLLIDYIFELASIYTLGAKKIERLKKGYHAALVLDLCFAVLAFLVIESLHNQISSLFLGKDGTALAYQVSGDYMRWIGYFFIFMGIKMATDGVLRGLGIMRPFLIANMVNLAIRLSVALICAPRFGIAFVWLAVPAGWLANFLISYAALRKSWPIEEDKGAISCRKY